MAESSSLSYIQDRLSARKTPFEICITGAISTGKSTLVNIIADGLKDLNSKSLPEGVEGLIQSGIFGDYIADINKEIEKQKNLAYIFQHGVMIAKKKLRKQLLKDHPETKLVLTERSVYDDRCIFAETLHKRGNIDDKLWGLYESWFDDTLTEIPFLPSAYIFIDLPTDICVKRMAERDRKGEDKYDKDYLSSLADIYQSNFGGKEFKGIPCYKFPSEFVVRGQKVTYPDYRSDTEVQKIIVEYVLDIIKRSV